MNKTTKNGYYKLKTTDGDKWLHFSRLFIDKIQEVSGKDITEFGSHLKMLDETMDSTSQFDAVTDLVMAAMMAHDEKEGKDIDYNLYKVGEWLYHATEEDDTVIAGIFSALNDSLPKQGKQREGRFTPQTKMHPLTPKS